MSLMSGTRKIIFWTLSFSHWQETVCRVNKKSCKFEEEKLCNALIAMLTTGKQKSTVGENWEGVCNWWEICSTAVGKYCWSKQILVFTTLQWNSQQIKWWQGKYWQTQQERIAHDGGGGAVVKGGNWVTERGKLSLTEKGEIELRKREECGKLSYSKVGHLHG